MSKQEEKATLLKKIQNREGAAYKATLPEAIFLVVCDPSVKEL